MVQIGKIIGITSGKGGVGKSTVTSLIASELNRQGYKVGILDADITGPSISKMFGSHDKVKGSPNGLVPVTTDNGIRIVSMNNLLNDEEDAVFYRGPMIAGVVKQFYNDVDWQELDYLLIDMPPGTGDVPLTIYQTIPIDGVVLVTSPQDLVKMIVMKSYNMAKKMNVPVLGIVENYSYFLCPDNGKKYDIFGESHIEEIAGRLDVGIIGKLPIDSSVAAMADTGRVFEVKAELNMALIV